MPAPSRGKKKKPAQQQRAVHPHKQQQQPSASVVAQDIAPEPCLSALRLLLESRRWSQALSTLQALVEAPADGVPAEGTLSPSVAARLRVLLLLLTGRYREALGVARARGGEESREEWEGYAMASAEVLETAAWCFAHHCCPSDGPLPAPTHPSVDSFLRMEGLIRASTTSTSPFNPSFRFSPNAKKSRASSSSSSSPSSSWDGNGRPVMVIDVALGSPKGSGEEEAAGAGMGVFTTRELQRDEGVWEETPLLAVLKDPAAGMRHCHKCLRFLPAKGWSSCPRRCSGVRYCSADCASEADAAFHRLLCPKAPLSAEQTDALESLNELAVRTTVRVRMLVLMAAMIASSPGSNPFSDFEAPSWRSVSVYDPLSGEDEEQAFARQHPGLSFSEFKTFLLEEALKSIHRCIPDSARWLSLQFADSLMGLIDTNATDLQIVGPAGKGFDRATGLFAVHSKLNHSCAPNCKVVSEFPSARIRVVTTRKLPPSTQALISYCDRSLPTAERQKLLKGGYLFQCQCNPCRTPATETRQQ